MSEKKTPRVSHGRGEEERMKDWLKKASEELKVKTIIDSGRDSLTGLLNRRGLNEEVERIVDVLETYKKEFPDETDSRLVGVRSVQVIAFDLSGFKGYNDTYGMPEGDNVLKEVAVGMLNVFSRATDIHARIGGDEYVIVALNTDSTEQEVKDMQSNLNSYLPEHVKTHMVCYESKFTNVDKIELVIDKATKAISEAKAKGGKDVTGRSLGGGLVYKRNY